MVWCIDILKCLQWHLPMGFECVEVCLDSLVRYQSIVSCSGQVCCWKQVNSQELSLQKKEKDDEFYECHECENDKILIQSWFNQRNTCHSQRWNQDCEQRMSEWVNRVQRPISTKKLYRDNRAEKAESEQRNWDDIIAEKLVCKISKFETLLFLPLTRNSVFDGFRTDLSGIKGCK